MGSENRHFAVPSEEHSIEKQRIDANDRRGRPTARHLNHDIVPNGHAVVAQWRGCIR